MMSPYSNPQVLRFEAKIVTPWAHHESERRFVFTYHLSDDTFSIFEPQRPNSGSRFGGRYLERCKVARPQRRVDGEPDYYRIDDFYIGEQE